MIYFNIFTLQNIFPTKKDLWLRYIFFGLRWFSCLSRGWMQNLQHNKWNKKSNSNDRGKFRIMNSEYDFSRELVFTGCQIDIVQNDSGHNAGFKMPVPK